ncbi:hypothetical protein J1N35_028836 [Gossypium stocksii]|uniref:Reverse transcriptase n=1 Tax=Gossypium stocksii TaxID=47602 RepID=A0A9D3ZSD6_9ROSI|nr:hypothetical protein J1N35_028836 [Gossypium stocksii]
MRGLRQGDSLSTFLFLICNEGLSTLLRLASTEGALRGIKVSKRSPQITHLFFADGCVLFGEASDKGVETFEKVIKEYEICSGQCVNYWKSTVFSVPPQMILSVYTFRTGWGLNVCKDMERIIAKFWWQKSHGKRRIHWCSWSSLCELKEFGRLGYRNFAKFNMALLAKVRELTFIYLEKYMGYKRSSEDRVMLKSG